MPDKKQTTIKVDGNVSINDDKKKSSAAPSRLTDELLDTLGSVETLSRYDDLSMLKIDAHDYECTAKTNGFGIKRNKAVHGNGAVIRSNQVRAAQIFLSRLRGFGLLADCVGSGKTYEAGVVISELAIRGKVNNLLVIVPDESLLGKWTHVLEKEFGMGEGQLQVLKSDMEITGRKIEHLGKRRDISHPLGAFIMLYDDFASIPLEVAQKYLFDLIVVDEAHHLCAKKKGQKNRSMYYLSLMMKTKREFNYPYCLLLTATPHSGNLENMFDLWYFISCKGGCPACFADASMRSKPSAKEQEQYEAERKHYMDIVCKGAKTVAEYIEKAKEQELVGSDNFESRYRRAYLSAFEYTNENGEERVYPEIEYGHYAQLSQYDRKMRRNAYLGDRRRADVRAEILDKVNYTYTNEVMRAIMVRHKNNFSSARKAHSCFFLPVAGLEGMEVAKEPARSNFFMDGKRMNAEQFNAFFKATKAFAKSRYFTKSGTRDFYHQLLNVFNFESDDDFVHITPVVCKPAAMSDAIFEAKCAAFVGLVRGTDTTLVPDGEVGKLIVFFDYDVEDNAFDKETSSWNRLCDYLKSHGCDDILARIIHGGQYNLKEAIEQYNQRQDAIFLAESSKCTEGQDMQSGQAILNFEVPINPLTIDQRIGRVYRLGQDSDVKIYSFASMNELDGYCLAYYLSIGILSDKNGDASILSGCNSENMVALKCLRCKSVSIVSDSDYMSLLPVCDSCDKGKNEHMAVVGENFVCKHCGAKKPIPADSGLRCTNCGEELGSHGTKHYVREKIFSCEYQCSNNPAHRLRRVKSKESNDYVYVCFSSNQETLKHTSAAYTPDGKPTVECEKLCAIKHCSKSEDGCPLRQELANGNLPQNEAKKICIECGRSGCKCSIDKPAWATCSSCMHAQCNPKPYKIIFDENYDGADCPVCARQHLHTGAATLEKKENNTFESYIRELYENDASFCEHFLNDAAATKDIKNVLIFDDGNGGAN